MKEEKSQWPQASRVDWAQLCKTHRVQSCFKKQKKRSVRKGHMLGTKDGACFVCTQAQTRCCFRSSKQAWMRYYSTSRSVVFKCLYYQTLTWLPGCWMLMDIINDIHLDPSKQFFKRLKTRGARMRRVATKWTEDICNSHCRTTHVAPAGYCIPPCVNLTERVAKSTSK